MSTSGTGNATGSHVESRRRVGYYIWYRVHKAETWGCGGGWGRMVSTQLVVREAGDASTSTLTEAPEKRKRLERRAELLICRSMTERVKVRNLSLH